MRRPAALKTSTRLRWEKDRGIAVAVDRVALRKSAQRIDRKRCNSATCASVKATGESTHVVSDRRGRQVALALQSRHPRLDRVVDDCDQSRRSDPIYNNSKATLVRRRHVRRSEVLADRVFDGNEPAATPTELIGHYAAI